MQTLINWVLNQHSDSQQAVQRPHKNHTVEYGDKDGTQDGTCSLREQISYDPIDTCHEHDKTNDQRRTVISGL